MIARFAQKLANYLFVGLLALFVGLSPWIFYSSMAALLVSRTGLNVTLPTENTEAMQQMTSIMGLLLAFLVTGNISISGQISAAVDNITGAATELAALTYTLLTDASCQNESDDIASFASDMLELAKMEKTKSGVTAGTASSRAFTAIHSLKTRGKIEAPLVGVFVKATTGVNAAHGSLWTLRNSGAHPSIRITLFVIASLNIVINISALSIEDERSLVATSIFIACSSIGIFTTSLFIRDPLDYAVLSHQLRKKLDDAKAEVEAMRSGTCMIGRSQTIAGYSAVPTQMLKF